jgi:hypothetical protein
LCAAAGSLAIAGAAHAAAPVLTSFDAAALTATDQGPQLAGSVGLTNAVALPVLSYGPPDTSRTVVSNLATSVALIDGIDLQLGYKLDLSNSPSSFGATNQATFDGLFLSSPNASYAALTSGGDFVGATAALADDLQLSLGSASLSPGYTSYTPGATAALARVGGAPNPFSLRAATSLLGGVTWNIAKWVGLGVNASQTSEHGGVLGTSAAGVNANTSALGFSARVALGGGWVTTATYSEGVTQLDLKPGLNPSLASDSLRTRSYGLAIAKNGLFGDDALGLAVSRPAYASDGSEFITLTGGQGQPQFFTRSNILAGTTPETDIEVGYVTTFLDGSLALQTNASYQMNYAGQTGATSVSLLSRARIKF